MEPNSHHIDARLYLKILWKRKVLWLLPPVVIFCTVAIGINVLPPIYEAATTVYYDDKPALTHQIQELTGLQGGDYAPSEQMAAQRTMDMISKIRSRPFLEQVVHTLRLQEDPEALREGDKIRRKRPDLSREEAAMEVLVENLRLRLRVDPTGATVFRIVARDDNPRNAQLLAKWVGQLFVDNTLHGQMQQIRAAGDFSVEQQSIYEKKLRDAEDHLREFQETMLGQQLAANPIGERNRDQARTLIRQASDELADLDRQVSGASAEAQSGARQPALLNSATLRPMGEELGREETDLGVMLLEKPSTDLSVAAQKERVGRTRQQIYDELGVEVARRFPNQSQDAQAGVRDVAYATMQMNSIKTRQARLQGYLDDYEVNYRRAPREQLELDRLRQDVETNRNLLAAFRNQATSSRISEAVESTNLGMRVEILEMPTRPFEPVAPDGPRAFGLAAVLGPMLGFAAVFLAEYLDSSYRSVEEIEGDLGMPVLGTVPRLEETGRRKATKKRWMPITVSAMLALTAVFFVLKFTLFPDLGRFHRIVQAKEPPNPVGTVGQ